MQMKDVTETLVMVFYGSPLRHIIVNTDTELHPFPDFLNFSIELHALLKSSQANWLYEHRPLHKLNKI